MNLHSNYSKLFFLNLITYVLFSCSPQKKDKQRTILNTTNEKVVIDCDYTFEQATAGTKAPKLIIDQLHLMNVRYYSMDGKIHQGQLLTNKKMVAKLTYLFDFMLRERFPIAQAIPVVKYGWDDNLSMQANNTYSFCYRNVGYSKHAVGMAIDINPYFNPVRWKKGYHYRADLPKGAIYDPKVPGTFCVDGAIVQMFKKVGFRWGHSFKRNFDDHHFEK